MTVVNQSEQACPNCGGIEVRPSSILKRHFNPWLFHLGGWMLALLWSGSRKEEVRCVRCETIFQRHTRVSKIARVLLILFLLLIVALICAGLLDTAPTSRD